MSGEPYSNWLQKGVVREQKSRIIVLFGALAAANAGAFVLFLLLGRSFPYLFSLGLLAYMFGLRHAVDADHIAAIDNTTRKLINDGRKPLTVGFFFSLGHSTIVFLLSFLLAVAAGMVKSWLPRMEAWGGIFGTLFSAAFMFLIAALNIVILRDIYQVFAEIRGSTLSKAKVQEMEELLLKRGLMSRVLGKASQAVRVEWQMYPVGILFGLGFDTASEVALLGMSAFAAGKGMPVFDILILPLLFTVGMCIVDTLDGVLMQFAYSWAFLNPIRKVYYNLTVTAVSVLVALGIGSVEFLQVIGSELNLKGVFWDSLVNMNFETLGYIIIGLLLASWGISVAVYKIKGYEKGIAWEETS